MNSIKVREYLRAHVLGLAAIFVALSGTAVAANDEASTSAVSNAKFKKLKKRVAALEGKLNSPARGDLQGTYPNLSIRNNAVTTGKIANNAVTNAKIADNAVTTTKIAGDAVTSAKILDGSLEIGDMGASTHLLCLAGFQYLQGACIQTSARPQQNFNDARSDCGIVGGRVATLEEVEQFKVGGGTISGTEYTLNALSGTSAITYNNSLTIGVEANSANAHQFHCVLNPTG
jgi:hypothetical protein